MLDDVFYSFLSDFEGTTSTRGLGFKPLSIDVPSLIVKTNEVFRGRCYIDVEDISPDNPEGWMRGKCINPDHEDANPSFGISKKTGIGHCMVCGTWQYGEILLMLDEAFSPSNKRIFPDAASVRGFLRAMQKGEATLEDMLQRGEESPAFVADDTQVCLDMALWAYHYLREDPALTEETLRGFDLALRDSTEEALAYYHRTRLLYPLF